MQVNRLTRIVDVTAGLAVAGAVGGAVSGVLIVAAVRVIEAGITGFFGLDALVPLGAAAAVGTLIGLVAALLGHSSPRAVRQGTSGDRDRHGERRGARRVALAIQPHIWGLTRPVSRWLCRVRRGRCRRSAHVATTDAIGDGARRGLVASLTNRAQSASFC